MVKKSGPKDVDEASRGSSPSGGVPGGPGRSFEQKPFAGPAGHGQPASMKKALAKKASRTGTTGYAGNLKPNPRA